MFRMLTLALACAALLAGCGRRSDGPARFDLTGTVTFDGKPVPIGTIRFSPDQEKGNNGPGASTTIRNGAYSTHAGKGIVGGPMVVYITGIDADTLDSENTLFASYRVELDLPLENSEQNFDVPATAAAPARPRRQR